jgi:hypothetical protein
MRKGNIRIIISDQSLQHDLDKYHSTKNPEIEKKLELLINNIFVVVSGQIFQLYVGILMGTNCAPLIADLFFLNPHEADLFKSVYMLRHQHLLCLSSRYIYDVLSINNDEFHFYAI